MAAEENSLQSDKRSTRLTPIRSFHTGFTPKSHGWQFVNSFRTPYGFPGIPPFKLGFCGGMILSAMRCYNKGQDLPSRRKTPPSSNENLYNYLATFQFESLKLNSIPNEIGVIWDWQNTRDLDDDGVGHRTEKQWSKIENEISKGKPIVLMVIRSEGMLEDMGKNHQVLAVGFEVHRRTRTLEIYDPNHPNETGYIVISWGNDRHRINAFQLPRRDNQRVRGYYINFCENYTAPGGSRFRYRRRLFNYM